MILNYGHTIGHAFEAATDFKRFKHGEAVAWGMIAAVAFGRELGLLKAKDSTQLTQLIHKIGPLPSLKRMSFASLWNALMRDKKFRSGNIHMILLKELGEAEIRSGIDPGMLRKFLQTFLAGS